MYGFSVDSTRVNHFEDTGSSYRSDGYASCPDDFQSRNIFDIERRQSENRNVWLDDYGWL